MRGKKHNIFILWVLPVFTGILLGLSALPSHIWFLNFIAFIPLLIASDRAVVSKKPFWIFILQLLIALIVFYFWAGLWVFQTANLGFLIGFLIVVPFVLLVSPFILFKKSGNRFAPVYFIAAWLAAEMVQSYFQLGSPFYNLGHNPVANPELIQWYEFTGAAGGTLWILAVNFLLCSLGKTLFTDRKRAIRKGAVAFGVLFLPMVVSLILFHNYKEKGSSSEVLVIHPSTDCRDVKYRINIYELMDIYLGIMLPQLDNNTGFVVLPETAITNAGWVADLNNNLVFDHFREKTASYPNLKLVTGAITYEAIPDVGKIKGYKKIPGIRYSEKYGKWYRTYNSALLVEKNGPVQIRTKEGLTPYQEYAPYPYILPRISPVGIDFQFSTRESNRQVFTAHNGRKTSALICYELVYNRIFFKAIRDGAEAFFVLLNEGWYNDPKVPRQFLQLSVIRAIENRRSIAHASNMGISAFINQRGEVVARQESKHPGFLKYEIRMNKIRTFTSKMGNYLGMIAFLFIILLIFSELIRKKSIIDINEK
jgi:apolipoprotein N-acyltransferase